MIRKKDHALEAANRVLTKEQFPDKMSEADKLLILGFLFLIVLTMVIPGC